MINKTLAILAGGKSSRMNYNNKALLSYKEKKFIEHIIEAGKEYKEIIIVSNNIEEYKEKNSENLIDNLVEIVNRLRQMSPLWEKFIEGEDK